MTEAETVGIAKAIEKGPLFSGPLQLRRILFSATLPIPFFLEIGSLCRISREYRSGVSPELQGFGNFEQSFLRGL